LSQIDHVLAANLLTNIDSGQVIHNFDLNQIISEYLSI